MFLLEYSAFARLRQVRLPFSSIFLHEGVGGFEKEWILLKKRAHYKKGKKLGK